MEENLIFFAIGGLLLLTLFVNSAAEAYEQKQREKRIKILRIKQGLDELSDLLESLKNCDISDSIRNLIANEIMLRLQTIQTLDRHFRGIQILIEEAKAEQETAPRESINTHTNDETEFKKKMIKLGRLIRVLNSHNWFSRVKTEQLHQYINDIKLLRCEQIFQFYSDMAGAASAKERYLTAKDHYSYIVHALRGSGINSHPRIVELTEQVDFMLAQMSENAKKMMSENSSEDQQEKDDSTVDENAQTESADASHNNS